MSNASKASSFLADLGIDDDLQQEIEDSNAEPETPEVQFIAYFKGDNPDCVWQYFHNPKDGTPQLNEDGTQMVDENGVPQFNGYGRLYGFWEEDKANKVARHFVEHKSNNLKLMDFDTFMAQVTPNKDCTKIFDSEADFLLELI